MHVTRKNARDNLTAKNARDNFWFARDKNRIFLPVTKKIPVTILGIRENARDTSKSARDICQKVKRNKRHETLPFFIRRIVP